MGYLGRILQGILQGILYEILKAYKGVFCKAVSIGYSPELLISFNKPLLNKLQCS